MVVVVGKPHRTAPTSAIPTIRQCLRTADEYEYERREPSH